MRPMPQEIRSALDYDPASGVFTWLTRSTMSVQWNGRYAGTVAGHVTVYGYRVIYIDDRPYFAHKLAWLWMTGEWASHLIDHEDNDKDNNRWRNLRRATRPQNGYNRRTNRNSVSGVKGVTWSKSAQKWVARINVDKRPMALGTFADLADAAAAYAAAARLYHGAFARLA